MATVTEAPPPPVPTTDAPFDLTIDVFARMVEADLIPRDRRVYLRDGRLFEKMAKTKAHGWAGAALTMTLVRRLPAGWSVWPESTVVLDPRNASLPDFAVIRGASAGLRHPRSLSGTAGCRSPDRDRRHQPARRPDHGAGAVARALIPAYWVVDVLGRRILVHAEPRVVAGRGAYARLETYGPGQTVPVVLDGQEVARIPYEDLLP